jgi:hypothetical protein
MDLGDAVRVNVETRMPQLLCHNSYAATFMSKRKVVALVSQLNANSKRQLGCNGDSLAIHYGPKWQSGKLELHWSRVEGELASIRWSKFAGLNSLA